MCKRYTVAVLSTMLSACVSTSPSTDVSGPAGGGTEPTEPVTPLTTVVLSEHDDTTGRNCENLTRPGSRIVVAQRCRPVDEDALAEQLGQVRREQDELERLMREREAQRRGF